MHYFLVLAALAAFSLPALAGWKVENREPQPSAPGVEFTRVTLSSGDTRAEVHVVSFPQKSHTLAVADNPDRALSLSDAAAQAGAVAGVNGGYFHPDWRPLGVVVSGGRVLHSFETARLLSGVVFATTKSIGISRAAGYKGKSVRAALQAGPFLVENGKTVPGLNALKSATRTVVYLAGERAGLVMTSRLTLAETSDLLTTPGFEHAPISRALNLDGGSSSGLWVQTGAAPFSRRPIKEVRNYLLVVPR